MPAPYQFQLQNNLAWMIDLCWFDAVRQQAITKANVDQIYVAI